MGGSSSTQSSTKVDPALMQLYNQNYSNASAAADKYAYVPYTGEQVAPFSQAQQQSFGALTQAANDPTAANATKQGMGVFGNLQNYQAPTLTPSNVNVTPYNAAQLSGTDLAPYLNPYTNDVVSTALGDLQHARDQQQVADNASATAAGAFGGTRQSVLNANTTNDYLRNVASTSANLRSGAYSNAQQGALADIAAKNAASQFNTTAGLNAGEFNAGQNLTAQQGNATNSFNAAQLRGNAALSGASLGQDYLNQQIQQGGVLNNVGAQQQALQQAQDEAAYQEFLRQTQAPLMAQQIRNQALGMIPQQATTTSSTTQSPGIGGILGGVGSLALGIGALGGFGAGGLGGIFGGGSNPYSFSNSYF